MDLSLIASTFDALRLSPPPQLVLLEAGSLASVHFPPTPPDVDTLLTGVDSPELALTIKNILTGNYPETHGVKVVTGGSVVDTTIATLDAIGHYSPGTCVFIPCLGEGMSFESFAEVVAHLRAPDGCPWDREQTHETLRTHLLEESYEALAAIDSGDFGSMCEEFGDLLLQIVLQAQIAREEQEFTVTAVIKQIYDKIVRRHPHVFGDVRLDGVQGVLQNWERLKEKERKETNTEKGLLDGVPAALPALSQAQEYQDRAARVGFDWPEIEGVLDKVREEIEEVKQAEDIEQVASELGDLFFVLVNLARWRKVDAESALRKTNVKFKNRFAHVERGAKTQGRNLSDMSLEEMDGLWNEGKRQGI
jgi:tetrapyrrole methylase family protein/MazG family protein